MSKFLILVEHHRDWFDEWNIPDELWNEKFQVWDDPYMKVVECKHKSLEDNLVSFGNRESNDTIQLLEDIDGNLYAYSECMTEVQIGDKFSGLSKSVKKIMGE